jgi:glyoxylase-like metal-dependent hydrolase (beta-lactamase superfamily II)
VIEVTAGVFQLSLLWSNTFLIEAGDGLALVDAGMRWDAGVILRSAGRLGWPRRPVKAIVLTHGDLDHLGAMSRLVEVTGAPVIAHRAEMPLIAARGWRPTVARSGLMRLGGALYGLALRVVLPTGPVTVNQPVEDGDELPGGFRVVHTPGHTPGHISLYHPGKRVLIAGDAIINRGRLSGPAGLFTPDMAQARASMRRLAELDVEAAGFGHGPPLRQGAGAQIRELVRCLTTGY